MRAITTPILALVVSAVALCACTTLSPAQAPIERPGAAPSIVFVASDAPPASNYARYTRAKAIAEDAGLGAASVAGAVAYGSGPFAPILVPFAAVLGATTGAVGSAIAAGASGKAPARSAATIERGIDDAIRDLRLSDKLVATIAEEARQVLPYEVTIADPGSESARALLDSHRAEGRGEVFEVQVTEIGFVGGHHFDRRLAFFMKAQLRLFDAGSGALARRRGIMYQSELRGDREWAQDNAALVAAEVERGYRALAQRAVESELLGVVSQVTGGIGPRGKGPPMCGLVPRKPAPGIRTHFGRPKAARMLPVRVDSTRPTLAWEPLVPGGVAASSPAVVYDLRIWQADGTHPGTLVYERYGLATPSHDLETPLAAGSTFYWSVRPRFASGGHPRALRWTASELPLFAVHQDTGSAVAWSMRRGERLTDWRCPVGQAWDFAAPFDNAAAAWTPCLCLDFVPPQNALTFSTPE